MNRTPLLIHLASVLVSRLLPLALFSLLLWQFHRTVSLLASGDTDVNPYLMLLASANRARSFAFFIGILGVLYGLWQRTLRLRAVAKMEEFLRISERP